MLKIRMLHGSSFKSAFWIRDAGWKIRPSYKKDQDYDVLLIPDGDKNISPSLYSDEQFDSNESFNPTLDNLQLEAIKCAIKDGKKIIGIGRGAHLICVASGGLIIQDIANHEQYRGSHPSDKFMHEVLFNDGESMTTVSMHSALMYPFNMHPSKFSLLGWAFGQSESKTHEKGDEYIHAFNQEYQVELPDESKFFGGFIKGKYDNMTVEPEMVFFRDIDALGIQYNPSMNKISNKEIYKHTNDLVGNFLRDEL